MTILYIGDVMGEVGLQLVERLLPGLIKEHNIDLVIAQAENLSNGKGVNLEDFKRLRKAGVDFCTGGNWTLKQKEIWPALNDPNQPIIRPANYPENTPGLGFKTIVKNGKKVLVISLLGKIVGKEANNPMDNPLIVADEILDKFKNEKLDATVVNFHGDYSSEKVIIGHYLDGKVSLVVGDHWHVPTADSRLLPKSTAHITDVGMCGVLNASLGVKLDSVITRWHDNTPTRNELETEGPKQFNAVIVKTNGNGLAEDIKQINLVIE
jgi:metallophosphoesterase (TIGR00282 family)